jgi:hypothetical protein
MKQKRGKHIYVPTKTTIPFPSTLFKTYIEKRQVKSIQEGIEKSRYSQTVKVAKEKLRFDPEIITHHAQIDSPRNSNIPCLHKYHPRVLLRVCAIL